MSIFHNTSRICTNCGMSVPEDNRFCEACGTPYAEPAAGADTSLYCPNGHPVEDSGCAFCIVCGEKLLQRQDEEEMIIPPARESAGGWTCSCGGVNEDDSAFCISCGQPKGSPAAAPAASSTGGWTCSCGGVNEDDSIFCVTCGSKKPMASPMASPVAAPVYTPESPVYEAPHTPRPDEVVIPPLAAKSGSAVEIPDIMRPLTDNDMKLDR